MGSPLNGVGTRPGQDSSMPYLELHTLFCWLVAERGITTKQMQELLEHG